MSHPSPWWSGRVDPVEDRLPRAGVAVVDTDNGADRRAHTGSPDTPHDHYAADDEPGQCADRGGDAYRLEVPLRT